MYKSVDALFHRLQYVIAALLLVVVVAMLPSLVSAAASHQSKTDGSLSSSMATSPNAVTRSFGAVLSTTSSISGKLSLSIAASSRSVAAGVAHTGTFAVNATVATARFGANTTMASIHGIGHVLYLTTRMPASVFGHTTHAITDVNIIRPADDVITPAIDPTAAVLAAATTQSRPAAATSQAEPALFTDTVRWPLRGVITTLFGVPEPPYQPIHTGMDISDGEPAGVSPIHAFKAGVVIRVIHEHIRLGNEVVVSHGNGLTSVYGHLNSTAVRVGQLVTTRSVVGYEGSTGVSTGPHLHFEIRVNGTPVNPARYIPGQP